METYSYNLKRQGNTAILPAIALLTRKLFKQTWKLLLVTLCGMIACVGLVCAIPLFEQVSSKTGLQQLLAQQPGDKQITYSVSSDKPTAALLQRIGDAINPLFQEDLGPYLDGATQLSLKTPVLQTLSTKTGKALSPGVSINGYYPAVMTQEVKVMQGRLPQTSQTTNETEIALTQAVATKLALHLGDLQEVRYPIAAGSTVWHLRVVGIVSLRSPTDNFWNMANLASANEDGVETVFSTNDVLASLPAILPQIAKIQETAQTSFRATPLPTTFVTLQPTSKSAASAALVHTSTAPVIGHRLADTSNDQSATRVKAADSNATFQLYWSYHIKIERIDGNNLSSFLQATQNLSARATTSISDAHIMSPEIDSPMLNILRRYTDLLTFAVTIIVLLLISMLGLSLFMVSVLANVLIENQLATIVMLRSRGALQRHIFGAFTLQALLLGLLALVGGPLFALLLVSSVGPFLLPNATQSTFSILISDLPDTIRAIWLVTLLTVAMALIVMVSALRRASLIDIVTLRQNASRSNQVPLWRRLYLDFFLVALLAIGMTFYQFTSTAGFSIGEILAPLSFLAVPLILVTVSLLCLRFFPLLTHLGTRLLTQRRAAPGVLAFAQMERQPHATRRMILLLSLSLATSIYLCTFIATQQTRIQDVSAYEVGADFSGTIIPPQPQRTIQALQAYYAAQPGVRSATLGYHTTVDGNDLFTTTTVNAVDADTYAQTATWSSIYTTQALQTLMKELIARRSAASAQHEIYAIVDTQLWKELALSPGETFTLNTTDANFKHLHFVALAQANYLPQLPNTDGLSNPTMMVDYQNYAAVYAQENHNAQIQPNSLLLHTSDNAQALSKVRQEFPSLQDRRALIAAETLQPLQIAITGTLMIGLVIAFLLVLIGVGLTAWLSVKQRRLSFSVLRALGMTPGQITRMLLWEQSFTYLSALALGLLSGWISTFFVVPAFSLVDHILQAVSSIFNTTNFPIQHTAQIPNLWLGLMLTIFLVICGTTLLLVSYYGTRPALGQSLRINED